MEEIEERRRWAASGALWLTGWPDGPVVGPPLGFVDRAWRIARSLESRSARLGRAVHVDPLDVITTRAALRGFTRGGQTSCGGSTHLLAAADGWLAVGLPREEDVDLVPAWLEEPLSGHLPEMLATAVEGRRVAELVDRGAMLGLPIGAIPSDRERPSTGPTLRQVAIGPGLDSLDGIVVADLSSLWAGPLCGALLAEAGATVIKIESTNRPDGARADPSSFFDEMNREKKSIELDFTDPDDHATLAEVLSRVDVVIEASRPRALEQLGIVAERTLRDHRPVVWVSITGHGRDPESRHRVGFGDDAAAAGGLVGWNGTDPCFCADAVADPLTGMVAAEVVFDLLERGGSWLADVSLAGVAATFAGPSSVETDLEPVPPRAPRFTDVARRPLGADTIDVLDLLEITR